jgi:hypothetical protein
MTRRKQHFAALVVSCALLAFAGTASAAFPNFTGCPTTAPGVAGCIDVQNTSGNLNIKGFNVPLGASLEIRGGLTSGESGSRFIPPAGTTGFFSTPVAVPGGLVGIEWLPGNSVLAITELAGPPSSIQFDVLAQSITVPVKVRLVNFLLGMDCHIGTDSNPVVLNLITGTTRPALPNRPISGHPGTFGFLPPDILTVTDALDVDNAFAIPGASRCGLGLGLINTLVNAKLRLPSAGGNNSMEVHNNIALRSLI